MYLLDTNVISELRRAKTGKAHPNVVAWAGRVTPAQTYLSAISILEIEQGILKLARKDMAQATLLRGWLEDQILPNFPNRILAIDTAVARRCARLHVPDQRGERDALIAATALVHGMTVITRDTRDFVATGVRLLDPWA